MEKSLSSIIGMAVVADDIRRPLAQVRDLVVDPDSGDVLGVLVDLQRNLVISPVDIVAWSSVLVVRGHDVISEAEDILRINNVLKKGIYLNHCRVESKNGEYVGKIVDYSIDSKIMKLKNLFTTKSVLGLLRYDTRVIPAKDIVEVLPGKIIVKANSGLVEARKDVAVREDLVGA